MAVTPKEEKELCLRALGAVVWYLQECLIDDDTFSLGLFEKYEPVDWEQTLSSQDELGVPAHVTCARHLVSMAIIWLSCKIS
jgi:hypothetical protein